MGANIMRVEIMVMNDKEQNDYKVTWGSSKGVGEILVHVTLALCVIYAIYSFFHPDKEEVIPKPSTAAEALSVARS
jgi:hypothetical protein